MEDFDFDNYGDDMSDPQSDIEEEDDDQPVKNSEGGLLKEGGDEDDDEVDADDAEDDERQANLDEEMMKKSYVKGERILLTGDDRVSLPRLSKFDRVVAVTEVINQLNAGAKLPAIVDGTSVHRDSTTFNLALACVMATVKRSINEVKTPEQISKGASVIIKRDIGMTRREEWKLHELYWLEASRHDKEMIEMKKHFVDSNRINVGDWFNS